MKNWRYGTPTPDHKPQWIDLRGQRFGHLVVIERDEMMWLCLCDCGKQTKARAGDLNRGSKTTCGNRTTHHRMEVVGYGAMHERLYSDRGPASSHQCIDCSGQASQWSYDHEDPDELHAYNLSKNPIAYSLDPDRYYPRCGPCHKMFDLDRINAASIHV